MNPIILAQYPRILPHEDAPRARIVFDTERNTYVVQAFKEAYANGEGCSFSKDLFPFLKEIRTDKQLTHPSFNWQHFLLSGLLQGLTPRQKTPLDEFVSYLPTIQDELLHHQRLGVSLGLESKVKTPQEIIEFSRENPDLVVLLDSRSVLLDEASKREPKPIRVVFPDCYISANHPLSHYLTVDEWKSIISIFCKDNPRLGKALLGLTESLNDIRVLDIYKLRALNGLDPDTDDIRSILFELRGGEFQPVDSSVCNALAPLNGKLSGADISQLCLLMSGYPMDLLS